jgi:hypothetical protein
VHREAVATPAGVLLPRLAPITGLHHLILAGGTGLALHLGHRTSVDLDFFTLEEFLPELLVAELRAAGMSPTVVQLAPGTLVAFVEGAKVSLFQYPYPFVDRPQLFDGVMIASVLDIAAMKLVAIAQRSARRDFVDLYVILQHTPFRDVAARAVQRYGAGMVEPVAIGKGLTWFETADSDPDPQYLERALKWKDVRSFFASNFRQFVLDLDAAHG